MTDEALELEAPMSDSGVEMASKTEQSMKIQNESQSMIEGRDKCELEMSPTLSYHSDESLDIVKATSIGLADSIEAETTEPSATGSQAALSDSDEGAADSDKVPLQKGSSSESSDSENASPVSAAESQKHAGSPSSWGAQQRVRRSGGDLKAADVARMARSLLNKLTEERFENLAAQILGLPFSTPEQLGAVAAEIFEKATTQDCFRSLYAELCTRLDTHLAEQTSAIGGKAFRKALVMECQATFERNLQPPEAALFADMDSDERLELEIKLKTRRLGNMRFIGELLVRRLLAPKLMPPIILELVNGDSAALEDLMALLAVVAPAFEQRSSLAQAPLKDAFAKLRKKTTEKGVSTRLRCQITDLLEARARGWTSRSALVA